MSISVTPSGIHRWVDGLSPVQAERLRIVAEMDDLLPAIEPDISPVDIMDIVANYFDLSVDDLICISRVGALVEARSIAMFLCRRMTDLSYPDIGRLFKRDHSTVVSACKKIEAQYADSAHPDTFTQVEELTARIKQKQHAGA